MILSSASERAVRGWSPRGAFTVLTLVAVGTGCGGGTAKAPGAGGGNGGTTAMAGTSGGGGRPGGGMSGEASGAKGGFGGSAMAGAATGGRGGGGGEPLLGGAAGMNGGTAATAGGVGGGAGMAGASTSAGGAGAGGAGAAGAGAGAGGGASGAAGSAGAGGFVRYTCPTGPFTPDFGGLGMPTRINGAPPSDSFNNDGNNFTVIEGPVWITDALYVSEFGSASKPPPSRILKIDANDNVSVAFPSVNDTGSNGLAVDSNGNLVSANHGVGGLVVLPLPSGAPATTLVSMFMSARFDSPNDLTVRSDGAIYFTDFSGDQTPSPAPQSQSRVYLLPHGSATATSLFADTNNPNGIALSLDEQTLYVGDGSGVQKYSVNPDGTVATPGTAVDTGDLSNQNTDGMAVDCAGDLYVVRVNTHDIVIVSPSGQKLGTITVPGSGQITNAAFGGADHKTLYITVLGTGTTRGVFKLAMPLPGMPF